MVGIRGLGGGDGRMLRYGIQSIRRQFLVPGRCRFRYSGRHLSVGGCVHPDKPVHLSSTYYGGGYPYGSPFYGIWPFTGATSRLTSLQIVAPTVVRP